jgi:hypothetical protein
MKLVTLAHVTLNRVGTAGGYSSSPHREVHEVREIPNAEPATLRTLVVRIATENGESLIALDRLRQVDGWSYGGQRGDIIFNVQGINVQWGSAYAVCHVYPALKIGERYFKLEEIQINSPPR